MSRFFLAPVVWQELAATVQCRGSCVEEDFLKSIVFPELSFTENGRADDLLAERHPIMAQRSGTLDQEHSNGRKQAGDSGMANHRLPGKRAVSGVRRGRAGLAHGVDRPDRRSRLLQGAQDPRLPALPGWVLCKEQQIQAVPAGDNPQRVRRLPLQAARWAKSQSRQGNLGDYLDQSPPGQQYRGYFTDKEVQDADADAKADPRY